MSVAGFEQPAIPPSTEPSNGDQEKWFGRLRGLLRFLADLGPYALAFTTYSLFLDHVSDEWIPPDGLRYGVAIVTALFFGLALRQILQLETIQHFLGGAPNPVAAMLPRQRGSTENDHGSFYEILDGTHRRLLDRYRCEPRGEIQVCGWSQFYDEKVPPSAIGSSYGLRIAMALDVRDLKIDRHRVIQSILAMQRPGGGWSASNQREVGRPEVTAWVLGALAPAGLSAEERARLVETLEKLLDDKTDPVGMASTCVVATAVSALALFSPGSSRLPDLADRLADGPVGGTRERPRWSATLRAPVGTESVPHTARAIVALHRAAEVLSNGRDLKQLAGAAAGWLCESTDLAVQSEQIRRTHNGESDVLVVNHFTPAWVARALMLEGQDPLRSEPLRDAVGAVVERQERGVWKWVDHREPVWMAYQGVSVLRDFGIRARASIY